MANPIKKLLRFIVYGNKASSKTYIKYLRKKGVLIGEDTEIFEPRITCIDETRPFLIEIGNNVQITRGVTILTHGYDWSVLKQTHNEIIGSAGKVKIGDNVFIGVNTTILKGVTIGDNVIIGANSLINKDVPAYSVVAGNPARIITDIESYYNKRKKAQLNEAIELIQDYYKRFNEPPTEDDLSEFFYLFTTADKISGEMKKKLELGGNEDACLEKMRNSKPMFNSFDELIKTALSK